MKTTAHQISPRVIWFSLPLTLKDMLFSSWWGSRGPKETVSQTYNSSLKQSGASKFKAAFTSSRFLTRFTPILVLSSVHTITIDYLLIRNIGHTCMCVSGTHFFSFIAAATLAGDVIVRKVAVAFSELSKTAEMWLIFWCCSGIWAHWWVHGLMSLHRGCF